MSEIFKKIPLIMAEVGPIDKDDYNQQQKYSFRGIEAAYNRLNPVLAKHGVFSVPEVLSDHSEERQSSKGSTLIYRILKIKYRFYASDGSFVEAVVIGEGMDTGDKAANKAMSVAHKYALFQVFCVPTKDMDDPDGESHEVDGDKNRPKASNGPKPLTDQWKNAVSAFSALGKKESELLIYLKAGKDQLTQEHLDRLADWYDELLREKGT